MAKKIKSTEIKYFRKPRVFDGKDYAFAMDTRSRREAEQTAKSLKEDGYFTRLVPRKNGIVSIYSRKNYKVFY